MQKLIKFFRDNFELDIKNMEIKFRDKENEYLISINVINE